MLLPFAWPEHFLEFKNESMHKSGGDYMQDNQFIKSAPITYPSVLRKACMDPFKYTLETKTGRVFEFESAEPISSEWIRIFAEDDSPGVCVKYSGLSTTWCPRGVEIRVSEIVWVADGVNVVIPDENR